MSLTVAGEIPIRPAWQPASEIGLLPCFAFEGRCASEPISTSDGRIFIHVIPVYLGVTNVFVDGIGFHQHISTCKSPDSDTCTYLVETKRAGTYIVTVEF